MHVESLAGNRVDSWYVVETVRGGSADNRKESLSPRKHWCRCPWVSTLGKLDTLGWLFPVAGRERVASRLDQESFRTMVPM